MKIASCVLYTLLFAFLSAPLPHVDAQEMFTFSQIGRGAIRSVAWYPNNEFIFISTVTGVWITNANLEDVGYLPDADQAQLSPDGRYIAGVDAQNDVIIWDAITFEIVENLSHDSFRLVDDLAWSPDGRYLAVAAKRGASLLVYVWEAAEGWEIAFVTISAGEQVSWSPNGRYLAIFTQGGTGHIWVVNENRFVSNFFIPFQSSVRWKNESTLFTITPEDTLYSAAYWDVETGEMIDQAYSSSDIFTYTDDGSFSLRNGMDKVYITNEVDGQILFETPSLTNAGDQAYISSMAWSHDEQKVAVGGNNSLRQTSGDLSIIDIASQQVEYRLEGAIQGIKQIAWSTDDRYLLAVDVREQIFVYEVESGALLASTQNHSFVGETAAWSPDGSEIAFGDMFQNVTVWNIEQNTPVYTLGENLTPVKRIEWQTDGDLITLLSHTRQWYNEDSHIRVWNIADEPRDITSNFTDFTGMVIEHLDLSANGNRLALTSETTMWLFDVLGGVVRLHGMYDLEDLERKPKGILLSPRGEELIIREDIYYAVPPYRTEEQQSEFGIYPIPFSDQTNVWSADGQLVSAIWNQWDHANIPDVNMRFLHGMYNDFTLRNYTFGNGLLNPIEIGFLSPDGTYAGAIDSSDNGMIWNTSTGDPVAWLSDAAQMAWSSDELHIAVQRTDGSLWIMEADGTILTNLPTHPIVSSPTGQLVWSPNGDQLAHLHEGVIDLWTLSYGD